MIITEEIKSQIEMIAKAYKLKLVVLFGSQAIGKTHKESDVDIAVLGAEKFDMIKLMMDFDKVFKRSDIEVVNMNTASPTMMRVLVEEGKPLYEKNSDVFFEWKLYAIRVWMDTARFRELRDKKLVEWARQVA